MRNIIVAFLIGPMLFGCLSGEESITEGNNSASDDDQSGNSAPTISGNPLSDVLFGQSYSFEPNAADADGDSLTFDIQNRPIWATFDSSTGKLSGLPTLGDVGAYNNIVISVSDGKLTASLPSYTVFVNQAALGSVSLSWTAPTENSDGSTLTDLEGYKIYYGRNTGNYDQEIRIDNPSVLTYVVEQLSSGTYYFSATAFNSVGIESAFSGEAVRTLN